MPALDTTRTLAELVTENPARAVLLDRLGLDFCCHGQRSLTDACDASGVSIDQVSDGFAQVADATPAAWTGGGRGALAGYVETTHHDYLHAELPALVRLAGKVHQVHGERHPELTHVAELVGRIAADLDPHLANEENDVFPTIQALEPGTAGDGRLAGRIGQLTAEHEALGVLLAELRDATGGYEPPADGCASYRSLYERLAALEADTHVHIHLENNVLFPAALVEAV